MATRLPSLLDRTILFAHRGARTRAREHSIDAFSSAVRLGATGIHVDAWTTSDGVVVLDRSGLLRRFPRRCVTDVRHDSIAGSFPTLEDLLETVADVPIRVAATDIATFRSILTVARARDAVDRLWLTHADLEVLADWRDIAPDVKLVNRTSLPELPRGPERRAAELAAARVDAVALPEGDWSGGMVTLFHRFEVAAFADGAHFERQLARLIDMGIDAVSGDHAERMAAVASTFE
jgi:glycerophosphoryl diester phosphodiesterase